MILVTDRAEQVFYAPFHDAQNRPLKSAEWRRITAADANKRIARASGHPKATGNNHHNLPVPGKIELVLQ
jgi:hypothetical protein